MMENLLPFLDEQQKKPCRRCSRCGREIYAEDGPCIYCLRYAP